MHKGTAITINTQRNWKMQWPFKTPCSYEQSSTHGINLPCVTQKWCKKTWIESQLLAVVPHLGARTQKDVQKRRKEGPKRNHFSSVRSMSIHRQNKSPKFMPIDEQSNSKGTLYIARGVSTMWNQKLTLHWCYIMGEQMQGRNVDITGTPVLCDVNIEWFH